MSARHLAFFLSAAMLPALPAGAEEKDTAKRDMHQAPASASQYRFRNQSIPAATADEGIQPEFSSSAARDYLDLGASLWARQKECVSCHTHGIYLSVRPALSEAWGPPAPATRTFFAEQAAGVRAEDDRSGTAPTRAAYLARGLAAWDEAFSDSTSPETDAALRYVLDMLADDGGLRSRNNWPPLNGDSYHGTAMAAMAVATAPGWLEGINDAELRARVDQLIAFLRDSEPKNDHQRVLQLWVSTRLPAVLGEAGKNATIEMIWSHQRDDGGWSIRSFATAETWGGGKRAEKLVAEPDYDDPPSDGYQTGLAVVVLRDAGVAADDPRIQKAVAWLRANQRETGRWWTRSLNTESRFHFITFSGSAYAALGLARCDALEPAGD